MAIMYPSKLPDDVLRDPKRAAECRVYDELRKQLDADYHVFYSSPWLGTRPDGSEVEGEADFIVAHQKIGMLVIEVKGGRINIDSDGQWRSKNREEITFIIDTFNRCNFFSEDACFRSLCCPLMTIHSE